MAVGDGVIWNEALPDNSVVANLIDDYDKDLRVGVSARMRVEHIWPASQTATSEAGNHNFITMQLQTAAPVMAATSGGALWVKSSGKDIFLTDSAGTDFMLLASAKGLAIIPGGTGSVGGVVLCSSANGFGVIRLAASTAGLALVCQGTAAAPKWEVLDGANVSGTSFGAWSAIAVTSGQATADGLMIIMLDAPVAGDEITSLGYTDAGNPASTLGGLAYAYYGAGGSQYSWKESYTMPVRSGDRWLVTATIHGGSPTQTLRWLAFKA
jgi:hypothetical protein